MKEQVIMNKIKIKSIKKLKDKFQDIKNSLTGCFFGLFFLVILILFLSSCAFDSGLTGGVITGKAGSTADDVKVLKMGLIPADDADEMLRNYEPIKGKIKDIKTATLWKKKKSTFDPDYCAVKLKDNPWIVQPFEHYEEIRIEDIKKKHSK